jgi:uncharacterized protein YjlB
MKVIRLFICLSILSVTFVTGASVEDYSAQKQFRENIKKVRIGMCEAEVIELLGEPSSRKLTDRSGGSLCFSAGSFHVEPSTNCVVSLEMSPDRHVVGAYPKEMFEAFGIEKSARPIAY